MRRGARGVRGDRSEQSSDTLVRASHASSPQRSVLVASDRLRCARLRWLTGANVGRSDASGYQFPFPRAGWGSRLSINDRIAGLTSRPRNCDPDGARTGSGTPASPLRAKRQLTVYGVPGKTSQHYINPCTRPDAEARLVGSSRYSVNFLLGSGALVVRTRVRSAGRRRSAPR